MKKSKKQSVAYQLLLWNEGELDPEKRLWLSFSDLKESQSRMRKKLFKEHVELKQEVESLKKMIWEMGQNLNQKDLFSDMFMVAK